MDTLLKQYRGLIENESDVVAVMANTSAFIYENLENLNWAGFYIFRDGELVLGPFQGKIACYRIKMDRGVCGHCATNRKSVVVDNVHEFPGHIACDSASNSELVVPVIKDGELFGVIDIDSFEFENFSEKDREFVEGISEIFAEKL